MRFKKVYIEITNICNLSCNFCPKTSREYKMLDVNSFRHILNELKGYTKYIYFHLMGEPFLNPNLGEFLKISYEMGFEVNITTNGTMVNKVCNILLKAKALRQVNFSLHSFEANKCDINFNDYICDIINFSKKASNNTNIISALRLWNLDTIELKANNNRNEEIFTLLEKEFGLNYDLKEIILKEKKKKLIDRVYLNTAQKFQWPNIDMNIISESGFCYGLRDQIGILVDGTVVPCCLDSEGNIPLGNIHLQKLQEILESKKVKEIYNGFSNRNVTEELCKRCGYRKSFG